MKVDVSVSPFDRSSSGSPIEDAIEDLVYEHLIDLVDFRRVDELEAVVAARYFDLVHRGELPAMPNREMAERTAALMARAWHRLIDDPRPAFGDWTPDDDCELCKAFADDVAKRESVPPTTPSRERTPKGSRS